MTCARIRGGNPLASGLTIVMKTTLLALVLLSAAWLEPLRHQASAQTASGVAILQVDTDRRLGTIDRKIYGQFLEHINHSVVDGLFAEQIRGAGFEGKRLRDLLDILRAAGRGAHRRGAVRAWREERAADRLAPTRGNQTGACRSRVRPHL